MYHKSSRNREVVFFESMAELVEIAVPAAQAMIDQVGEAKAYQNFGVVDLSMRSWIGREFQNYAAFHAACSETWALGMKWHDEMIRQIGQIDIAKPVSRKRRTRFDEDNGDEVDHDRLRSGQPFWRSMSKQNVSAPAVATLVIELTTSASEDESRILWRGVAGIVLANLLEAAGYSVEVWGVHYGARGCRDGAELFAGIKLKAAGDPLNVESIIAGISGWFYRVMLASNFAAVPATDRQLSVHGVGVRDCSAAAWEHISADAKVIGNCFSLETAVEKVKSLIGQFQTQKGGV